MRTRMLFAAGLISLVLLPLSLAAQEVPVAPYRQGFWIGFGLGPSHTQSGCDRCGPLRQGDAWSGGAGLGYYLAAGGTPRPNLLVGGEFNGYTRVSAIASTSAAREMSISTASVVAQWYPVRDTRIFLKGGAGYGLYELIEHSRLLGAFGDWEYEPTIESWGWSVQAGVGYDLLPTRRFALVPFVNVVQVFAESAQGSMFNEVVVGPSKPRYLQLGLGFQWY
jgi:hypothetical protein